MNVLVACEESQEVCKAFRERGHRAFSCDIQECSGGHPEWHIKEDVLRLINGRCDFVTMDGKKHTITDRWDLIIAHPPCTFLSDAGNHCYSLRVTPPEKVVDRMKKREEAIVFFLRFIYADCAKIAVENPKGRMSTVFRKPDQYIDPWMFAESINDSENYFCKRTGLWLKGLSKLTGTGLPKPSAAAYGFRVQKTTGIIKANTWTEGVHGTTDRGKERSKTRPGIAKAMAEQWG